MTKHKSYFRSNYRNCFACVSKLKHNLNSKHHYYIFVMVSKYKVIFSGGSDFQQTFTKKVRQKLRNNISTVELSVHITQGIYKIVHLIFFLVVLSFLPVLLPSVSIFRARISLMRSKKTLSTFSRVFADVST